MNQATVHRLSNAILDQFEERNFVARFWRANACARHGVPFEESTPKMNVTTLQVDGRNTDNPDAPVKVITEPVVQPADPNQPSNAWKWVMWALVPIAVLLGGVVLWQVFEMNQTASTPQDRQGFLYSHLEQQGYHVPIGDDP